MTYDRVVKAGKYRVVVEQTHLVRYTLATLVAWPLSFLLMDDTGGLAPTKRYRVGVQSADGNKELWAEAVDGESVYAAADEMAEQITRIGIEDFLFKKEHGWRID